MVTREEIISAFPTRRLNGTPFHDLATVIWGRAADRFAGVSDWIDLIDMQVDGIGTVGIGPLLTFMDADLAVAFIPAWMVIALEGPLFFAGFMPALSAALDPNKEGDVDAELRFSKIHARFSMDQRILIADVMNELSDLFCRSYPDVQKRFSRISTWWKA